MALRRQRQKLYWILLLLLSFGSETDPTSLPILLFLLGVTILKINLRLRCFKSDWDEIWQDCSSSKYVSIDRVGFLIRCRPFKMVAVTSFHTENYCHLCSLCCICNPFAILSTAYSCLLFGLFSIHFRYVLCTREITLQTWSIFIEAGWLFKCIARCRSNRGWGSIF